MGKMRLQNFSPGGEPDGYSDIHYNLYEYLDPI